MLVFDPTLPTDSNPGVPHGAVVTLGNFDGVHQGHVALVATASTLARELGNLPVLALALDPHPRALLGQPVPAPLTTPEDRLALLRQAGATHAALLRVSPALLALDAETFFQKVLVQSLRAKALVEGHNFCFGRARAGTIDTLKKLCPASGMRLGVVQVVALAEGEVSSTRIRAALAEGDVTAANNLLNRPYRLRGTVVHGAHRGRTIGFPTANLAAQTVVPAPGVYACQATLPDGGTLPAATHIGPAPTFGDTQPRVEAHLLDFSGDLYGQHLSLDFLARVRQPRQFPSPAELVGQLNRDITAIRALCSTAGTPAMTTPVPDDPILRVQKLCDEVLAPLYDLQTSRVRVVAIDGPVAQVRLEGACASCVASTRLLFTEIEALLQYHKDPVEYLEVVP